MSISRVPYITRVAAFKRKLPAVINYQGAQYVLAVGEDIPEIEVRNRLRANLTTIFQVLESLLKGLHTEGAPSDLDLVSAAETLAEIVNDDVVAPLNESAARRVQEEATRKQHWRREPAQEEERYPQRQTGAVHSYDDEHVDNVLSGALDALQRFEQDLNDDVLDYAALGQRISEFVVNPLLSLSAPQAALAP